MPDTQEKQQLKIFFKPLLHLFVDWAREREAEAMHSGCKLDSEETRLAILAGVQHPERVRILRREQMPLPAIDKLRSVLVKFGFANPATTSLTYGYAMFMRQDISRFEFVHELFHVRQYEQLGGTRNFLARYMAELVSYGHDKSPLEVEARDQAARLLADLAGGTPT